MVEQHSQRTCLCFGEITHYQSCIRMTMLRFMYNWFFGTYKEDS